MRAWYWGMLCACLVLGNAVFLPPLASAGALGLGWPTLSPTRCTLASVAHSVRIQAW
jgi:hypothetical protein